MATSDSLIRTRLPDRIAERTTPLLTATLIDEAGDLITTVTTITLLIHASGTVVRSRASVASDFSAGVLAVRLAEADTRIVGSGASERHTALIEWTWQSGTRAGRHEIVYEVDNLTLVPAS